MFIFDEQIKMIKKDDEILEISELEFEIMNYLYKNKDRIIQRNEIMNAIPYFNNVEEKFFTNALTRIRRILKDDHRNPKYIKTHFKKGYQWIYENKK